MTKITRNRYRSPLTPHASLIEDAREHSDPLVVLEKFKIIANDAELVFSRHGFHEIAHLLGVVQLAAQDIIAKKAVQNGAR